MFANKRAELWGSMREWPKGGVIPPTPELIADLEGVEYGYVMKNGVDAIQLEKKEDMKKRGLASSDFGDALALTFAYRFPRLRQSVDRADRKWTPIAFHCTLTTTIRLGDYLCSTWPVNALSQVGRPSASPRPIPACAAALRRERAPARAPVPRATAQYRARRRRPSAGP